jgi:hypothetical protein
MVKALFFRLALAASSMPLAITVVTTIDTRPPTVSDPSHHFCLYHHGSKATFHRYRTCSDWVNHLRVSGRTTSAFGQSMSCSRPIRKDSTILELGFQLPSAAWRSISE